MIACLFLLMMQPATPVVPPASQVEWTGQETLADALKTLSATGNSVIDGRAAHQQPVTAPALKLTPGKKPFWVALDELCAQANLQAIQVRDHIELSSFDGKRAAWIAYDGPWRAKIIRRSIIGFENPILDRLVFQVELSLEPRYQPLLFTMRSVGQQRSTYSFENEVMKMFELRLPVPPRSQSHLENLVVEGEAWLAPSRLTMTLPLAKPDSITRDGTKYTLKEIDINTASKTWELTTELEYPRGSLEWESNQRGLLNSMKLVLNRGNEEVFDVGREIQTDAGRRVSATWFFRNVPGKPGDWKATLHAPAAPILMPVKFSFSKVELP